MSKKFEKSVLKFTNDIFKLLVLPKNQDIQFIIINKQMTSKYSHMISWKEHILVISLLVFLLMC